VPLLHESVGIRRWSAVIVGFAGALLVIRPGSGLHDPAVLLLLLSSAAYALYQIATRWVGFYDDAAIGIVFSALLGSLAMTAVLPFVFVLPRNPLEIVLFCSLGLLGGAGHYLVIRAFQFGPAAVIAPLAPGRPALAGRSGGDRHRDARLSDLRQFPRHLDLARRRDHHRLGDLYRTARAAQTLRRPLSLAHFAARYSLALAVSGRGSPDPASSTRWVK
jgi:hypothetical protein